MHGLVGLAIEDRQPHLEPHQAPQFPHLLELRELQVRPLARPLVEFPVASRSQRAELDLLQGVLERFEILPGFVPRNLADRAIEPGIGGEHDKRVGESARPRFLLGPERRESLRHDDDTAMIEDRGVAGHELDMLGDEPVLESRDRLGGRTQSHHRRLRGGRRLGGGARRPPGGHQEEQGHRSFHEGSPGSRSLRSSSCNIWPEEAGLGPESGDATVGEAGRPSSP